ncbi:hypothetical protein DVH24_022000 [Malus domestica]|uniref:Uncharacterized protein n=1 Tax=Malus domestica TaxID=3750 RepID=A0A498IWR9_MALDO|nr:hypothetical protein DVH24_022000 [Malus domestica]
MKILAQPEAGYFGPAVRPTSPLLSHPGPRPLNHGFVSGNSYENFPVGHPSWDCSCAISLNFGVPMEPEVSELPKGLVLYGGGHVHLRHR